ncbi:hypothetical protein COL154_005438 [Colletotrichum chrysophilum]|uniref:uncharacterized protein n=1 Tax=Colletotrichum chrysophilum TaxID=1836956 RepID=UPI0023002CAE|nr:uncharacterized protein COL26b_011943 [Colletotrichum chrysophilum]KAJ0363581.1 hypothetical protein COL154_005438 [Colletotrichum chrysophilum]KAJ0365760.1 hypothetical protein COL26b_011943 [Colletotrichum chrysophilum]
MFSSISRILGRTPQKNSSPGPTRPSPDDHDRQPFPSTAPPGIDLQFSEMSQDWGRTDDADKDDEYDGPDGIIDEYPGDAATYAATDEYVDPFADMAAFSTQVNDEDDAAPAYESEPAEPEPKAKKAKKAKKSKKTEDKETRKSKRKSKKTDPSSSADKSLPSPTTSGREDASDDEAQSSERLELKVEPGTSSIPVPEKKKRKRKSSSKAADAEPAEAESAKPRKKRKTRKPLEDIEDDEMETQPEEMIPDSPSTSYEVVTKAEPHSVDVDQDLTLDYTLQDEPQQSQLVSVSRQLFQPAKGTSTAAVSMSDDDREVSLSSPSVIAQRRRSMSRGSQISTFRQGLSRESTGMPDRISEAAESADENEAEDGPSEEHGSAAAVSDNSEDESASEAAGDVSMADASAVASGALVDGESQDDFADQLPPSSQPPREDTPSADEDAMDVDEEAADAQEESEEQSEPEVEQPHLPTPKRATARKGATTTTTATPGTARGRKANLLINMSDASHQPSSAQKSARSTSSKRQRSKPTFFAQDVDDNQEEETVQAPTSPAPPTQKRSKKAASTSEPKASSEKRPNLKARSLKAQPSAAATPKPKAIRRLQSRTPSSAPNVGGLREGQFSMEEINRLNARLKLYQERQGLSREQLLGVIHMKHSKSAEDKDKGPKYNGELFKEFWDFVSTAFPDRKRQRVIDTTRQEYRTNILRGGGWTPQEDAKILELHEKYNGSWAKISSEIGRLPTDIRARYKNYLICGHIGNERKAWTKDEEQELVDAVLTVARRMEKPYRREVTKPLDYVNWQSVSDEMGRKRTRLQCSRKWKQMKIELTEADLRGSMDDVPWPLKKCRLQIREMAPEDKYRLVESISKQAPGPDSAIKWTTLVDVQFRRKWHKDTLKLLWFRLKQQVPQWREKTVRDCARFLLDDAAENHPEGSKFLTGGDDNLDADRELKVISATRRKANKGNGKQPAREQSVTGNELSTMLITASDAEEDEEDDEDDEADETRASNEETMFTQDDTQFSESASTSPRLGIAPSLLPPGTQQANSAEPSPAKKRVRLSRGKTARGASEVNEDEEDSPNGTPTQSQFGDRAIPDRLTEKKMVARQRKTSGRAQSVASMQVDSVQNSDVDDDMPEIRVPPSTQPSRFKAINSKAVASASQGNFARKTGSNVLPGEPVEVTEEVMAALAEAESSDFSEEDETTEAAPVSARRRKYRKRPRRGEVAESPA